MSQIEITPEIFTADYVGRPGRRTFYLQARSAASTVSLLAEKQQLEALAEKLRELLVIVDGSDTITQSTAQRDPALAMVPEEPQGRVGTIGLAYEEDNDRVLIVVQSLQEEALQEEGELQEGAVPPGAGEDLEEGFRFVLRRDQVRAFVLHSEAVVAEGRPLCRLCGLPMDPEGHACPASNGHRPTG
jgi:uncharacterized repeat protein (TIGR03847 family)